MSTIGPVKAFTVNLASNTTYTSALDLGGGYGHYLFVIPSMVTGTDLRLYVSDTEDGTFRTLYSKPISTPTFTVNPINFDSALTSVAIPIDIGAQFVKVGVGTLVTGTSANFKFICTTN
jgi:hypothetical protein